jgi:hypothetical protein
MDQELNYGREFSRTMKLPSEIEVHEEVRLLTYRPSGVLDEASVNKIVEVIGELEAIEKEPFNRFWDTSQYHDVKLNFRFATNVALYRRLAYSDRSSIKSAIFATDRRVIHYGRLLAMLTQGSPIKVRVFRERGAAADWLDVPSELLMPKPAS